MKRKIYSELLAWKDKNDFKPLIVLGVRQCGKSYIIDKFCKENYSNYKKINLFSDSEVVDLYKTNKSSSQKCNELKLLIDFDFDKEDSILFIDEIQYSEELIADLKYFAEEHSKVRIICAGSLLGVKLARLKRSFPVGKISRLYLYPMDFEEYLMAFKQDKLIERIKYCFDYNESMSILHEKALIYYRMYLLSGGLPESVKEMINKQNDYYNYDLNILNDIVQDYSDDMSHHVNNINETLKIRKTYNSLANQLNNSAKKFQYNKIDKNAKSRDYSSSLNWLEESNMVQICKCIKQPNKPLNAYTDEDIFKIYYSDVGILNRLLDNSIKSIILDDLGLYKGIIAENYVANQLMANGNKLYYWKSKNEAEVDFLLNNDDGIIPIEVKSSDRTQSKSLKVYNELYKPKYMIRVSTKDFGFDNNIKSIPLYAAYLIK